MVSPDVTGVFHFCPKNVELRIHGTTRVLHAAPSVVQKDDLALFDVGHRWTIRLARPLLEVLYSRPLHT